MAEIDDRWYLEPDEDPYKEEWLESKWEWEAEMADLAMCDLPEDRN